VLPKVDALRIVETLQISAAIPRSCNSSAKAPWPSVASIFRWRTTQAIWNDSTTRCSTAPVPKTRAGLTATAPGRIFELVKLRLVGVHSPREKASRQAARRCVKTSHSSIGELVSGPEIYALASPSPLDLDRAKRLLTQNKLPDGIHAKVALAVDHWPTRVNAGSLFRGACETSE
jgi:hypothetical protein